MARLREGLNALDRCGWKRSYHQRTFHEDYLRACARVFFKTEPPGSFERAHKKILEINGWEALQQEILISTPRRFECSIYSTCKRISQKLLRNVCKFLDMIYAEMKVPAFRVIRKNQEELQILGPEGPWDMRTISSYPSKNWTVVSVERQVAQAAFVRNEHTQKEFGMVEQGWFDAAIDNDDFSFDAGPHACMEVRRKLRMGGVAVRRQIRIGGMGFIGGDIQRRCPGPEPIVQLSQKDVIIAEIQASDEDIEDGRLKFLGKWMQTQRGRITSITTQYDEYVVRFTDNDTTKRAESALGVSIKKYMGVSLEYVGRTDDMLQYHKISEVVLKVLKCLQKPALYPEALGSLVTILCSGYAKVFEYESEFATPEAGTNPLCFWNSWPDKFGLFLYLLLESLQSCCTENPAGGPSVSSPWLWQKHCVFPSGEEYCSPEKEEAFTGSEHRHFLYPHRCLRNFGNLFKCELVDKMISDKSYTIGELLLCILMSEGPWREKQGTVFKWKIHGSESFYDHKNIVDHALCVILLLAGVVLHYNIRQYDTPTLRCR
ncbi:hypothetical protein T484DRAFT_1754952 [Baffinella frigidus]|nr:hypothetical protein T484DRAFT_1754952 [Cryptophyta sp. CCMP2293]